MIAIIDAYKAGLFRPQHWAPNIIAGIIVGVIALPLAMAFAIASGAKPEQGIYTAIISGIVVGLFGGSRIQIAGPTGAFIVILATITSKYGISGLQVATIMAGFILTFMGIVRLGNVIKFIPDPVIVGFTSGIGVIIFVSEWKDFFGLPLLPNHSNHFHEKLLALISAFPHLNFTTTILALISLLLMLFSSKIRLIRHVPSPLVALVVVTLLQALFQFSGVATLGSVYGKISPELPSFYLPNSSFSDIIELVGPAFTIALLGAIESLLSAVIADGMAGTRHGSNQELIGQGLANIVCPLFGGFAATGAIARTATSIRNGGNSPLAAIVHSLVLLLIILLLAPLAQYIPLCSLAAILFVVAYNMSDVHHFYHMVRYAPKNDVFILISTFILTIFMDLVVAVNAGIILSLFLFTQRMSKAVTVEQETTASLQIELGQLNLTHLPSEIIVYSIQGPFFFAAAETLEHTLSVMHMDPQVIIFRLKNVPFMDITGLQTFQETIEQLHNRCIEIFICEANSRVYYKLANMNIFKWIHEGHIFPTLNMALKTASRKHEIPISTHK
ncbi:MAG: sodium-independent anion transporter [Alphaproteobacteria bacterium 41-28]|nr:MAG: sodium-independent anion transporter [Alphaproteobacteria bacterium 41-28]